MKNKNQKLQTEEGQVLLVYQEIDIDFKFKDIINKEATEIIPEEEILKAIEVAEEYLKIIVLTEEQTSIIKEYANIKDLENITTGEKFHAAINYHNAIIDDREAYKTLRIIGIYFLDDFILSLIYIYVLSVQGIIQR